MAAHDRKAELPIFCLKANRFTVEEASVVFEEDAFGIQTTHQCA